MGVEWEETTTNHGEYLYRAKVFGGWLVKSWQRDGTVAVTMTFVPDQEHRWLTWVT